MHSCERAIGAIEWTGISCDCLPSSSFKAVEKFHRRNQTSSMFIPYAYGQMRWFPPVRAHLHAAKKLRFIKNARMCVCVCARPNTNNHNRMDEWTSALINNNISFHFILFILFVHKYVVFAFTRQNCYTYLLHCFNIVAYLNDVFFPLSPSLSCGWFYSFCCTVFTHYFNVFSNTSLCWWDVVNQMHFCDLLCVCFPRCRSEKLGAPPNWAASASSLNAREWTL